MSVQKSLLVTAPIASVGASIDWLQSVTHNWPAQLCRLLERERSIVRVLLVEVRGSAPREPGTCMLVGSNVIHGTIGGGALEQHAIETARGMLGESGSTANLKRLVLGTQLNQCCGGVVQIWVEKFTRTDLPFLLGAARIVDESVSATLITTLLDGHIERQVRSAEQFDRAPVRVLRAADDAIILHERMDSAAPPVWIYGAGHVGQALVRTLADLPLCITWIDSRDGVLPSDLPAQIRARHVAKPVESIREAPAGTRFLVLTHDHALDYELCLAILQHDQFAWLGLIGSKSKGAKFRSRLAREAVSPELIERMVCPIGITGIASKWPAAIAVAVAAQLLQTLPAEVSQHRLKVASEPDCSVERCVHCSIHTGASHKGTT